MMTKEQIAELPEETRKACIEAHRRYLVTAREAKDAWQQRQEEHRAGLETATRMLRDRDREIDELRDLLRNFPEARS